MTVLTLISRALAYYWRTNLAVVLGVSVAVAVLAGALLVGESVRGSLRDLALGRLGMTDTVVSGPGFFREGLADDLAVALADRYDAAAPMVALDGIAIHPSSGRRAHSVQVYGVDRRFWAFHGRAADRGRPSEDGAWLSPALAGELGVEDGEAVLVRVPRPTDIPLDSLHGRKDDVGQSVRVTVEGVLAPADLGEFSLRQQQAAGRAIFVALAGLQDALESDGLVNTVLLSRDRAVASPLEGDAPAGVEAGLRERVTLDDLGITLRALADRGVVVVEAASGLLGDPLVEAVTAVAEALDAEAQPILTYLALTLRRGEREVPYSLVTAVDLPGFSRLAAAAPPAREPWPEALEYPPLLLNAWAADELAARRGDLVEVDYYLWQDEGRLITRTAEFQVFGVVPVAGVAADRELAPVYPGISDAQSLADWDPPFPIDLGRVRPRDEGYWDRYRTTPKGFIELRAGQELWRSRYGQLTSIRLRPADDVALATARTAVATELLARLDPLQLGFTVSPVRTMALEASVGTTDFGEYFTYFSFFLVVSALLLASLFFRLGVEQRLREVGLLRSLGFSPARIRGAFSGEALVLATVGSVLGAAGAIAYATVIMYGLRTWWVDAVGTTLLTLHVSPLVLIAGGVGGVLAAVAAIAATLRAVAPASARRLLSGALSSEGEPPSDEREGRAGWRVRIALLPFSLVLLVGGLAILGLAVAGRIAASAGFFGAGSMLLVASLGMAGIALRRPTASHVTTPGPLALARLGLRSATCRPGRSVLCLALIASAAFIIVAVDAFRKDGPPPTDPSSGTGGFTLLADSVLPLAYDLESIEGRESLGLADLDAAELEGARFARFRVRPGDDASCLNLYQAQDPRIVAPTADFLQRGRFRFASTLGGETVANPWLLLERQLPDGAIPAIADANSLTYALHLAVGDELTLNPDSDRPVRLRIVAALLDSVFQSELLISEEYFQRVFPDQDGFRFFMIEVAPARADAVTAALEERLSDYGFDVASTAERLAAFHRVENTYLATFQTLGGLGLLLGTLGLAAIVLRNVLERRRELALLRAVGFRSGHISAIVLAENALLLIGGLTIGTVCALLAIAPAWLERGGRVPLASVGWLLALVALAGLAASVAGARIALRAPLLASLRSE